MTFDSHLRHAACPPPQARAALAHGARDRDCLLPIPPDLRGALAAIVRRDTRGLMLSDAQRLSHFPASPLLSLSWFQEMQSGIVMASPQGYAWQPFETQAVLSGSQSQPLASWSSSNGRGIMLCFTADIARQLFDVDVVRLRDRIAPALDALGSEWQPFLDAMQQANSDVETLAALEAHLAPCWRKRQSQVSPAGSLRQLGRRWVGSLAQQARQWGLTHSQRQVERRIKAHSGRSLREWQTLVKTEGVFFSARERHASGQALDWADLALQEGFVDQAHLSRASKRITGFAPGEFARRFVEDESFWLYRLWV
ncbi:AraC family transcriptional regulator [Chromobacterium amazonense]|nr:AraC family transcriptional regulator [Chromobacterium amazonense]